MKKTLKILILPLFSLCLILCLCFNNKVSANENSSNFIPFEIGDILPVGYELTFENNSNGVFPTNVYSFSLYNENDEIISALGTIDIVATENNNFNIYIGVSDDDWFVSSYIIGQDLNGDFIEGVEYFKLNEIISYGNNGLLGVNELEEPNAIYDGVYSILANLLYGSTENLTATQDGTLVFFSQLIVILCLLLPFILVFMVIRLLFK